MSSSENNKAIAKKSPHAGHRQRVIDKFINYGLDSFCEHEVLELILFFAIPRSDTNKLAHEILSKMGSLENVFEATADDLIQIPGVGKNTATLLSLLRAVWEYKNTKLHDKRVYLRDSFQIGMFCQKYFSEHVEESAIMLSLDSNGKLKHLSTISKGTVNQTPVYMSKILKDALSLNAAAVVIAHNHPGGTPQPSTQDKIMTKKIYDVLKEVNIYLLDHIICSESFFSSLRERGMFDEMNLI